MIAFEVVCLDVSRPAIVPVQGQMEQKDFQNKFCQYFGVKEENFERHVLQLCLHPPWCMIAVWLFRVRPQIFSTDVQIVRQLGRVTSGANFVAEVRDLRTDYARHRDFGFAHRHLRRRLSTERLLNVGKMVWK